MSLPFDAVFDCDQWKDCASCVANTRCAFCASLNKCIQGNWFGVVNKTMDYCPVTDFYYKQCQFSSLPLGIMALFVLLVLLTLVLIGFCYLCCCCSLCCSASDPDEEENQALLGDRSKYLRRSSTYYQWNRSPPTSTTQFQHQPHVQPASYSNTSTSSGHGASGGAGGATSLLPHLSTRSSTATPRPNSPSTPTSDNWESRRSTLLKKFAREPSSPTSTS
ncbi:hypothetical protein BC940DRAFT_294823 [Gongronella butleri]|nr:hypothetical protein BC940DRAFT_294823 [Gongronella butleri]